MTIRDLYHGTTGDNVLRILRYRQMVPNSDGKIFFSEYTYDSVLMHGADMKRKVALAVKVRVHISSEITLERVSTPGVSDTLVVKTGTPLPADVLELYVREPRASTLNVIRGAVEIERFLAA